MRGIQYIIEIKSVIGSVKQQYASKEQNLNLPVSDISNDKLILDINDQLFFEVLLMQIRGRTISYSSYIKKQESKQEEKLLNDIKNLESHVILNQNELTD